MLSFAAICPHPPILIPAFGGEEAGKVRKTASALESLAREIIDRKIETLVIISPHGTIFMDAMSINTDDRLIGDFSDFQSSLTLDFTSDKKLAEHIIGRCDNEDFPLEPVSEKLDHGSMVPLYFLAKDIADIRVCQLSFSYLDYGKHLEFGKLLSKVFAGTNTRIALIASGDLSHRLTREAPAGYCRAGQKFDDFLIDCLENNDTQALLHMDQELIDEAGECGLRSILILLGAISPAARFQKLSYEGPFGVGYLVGRFQL
jgi:AmmeMemoRadiSam system protein B